MTLTYKLICFFTGVSHASRFVPTFIAPCGQVAVLLGRGRVRKLGRAERPGVHGRLGIAFIFLYA